MLAVALTNQIIPRPSCNIREPAAFSLLDRLATCEFWDFSDAEQAKLLEAAYLLFAPFEQIYLADPDHIETHPSSIRNCKTLAH